MTGLWLAYWESLCRSRCPQIKSYGQLVECFFWSFGSCEVAFLFVCCWYIWAIFDTFPNRCPHDSIYVQLTQCYLQKAGRPDQLLVCWIRNCWKMQKISSNLVWLTLEQEQKLFLPLRRLPLKKKEIVSIQMQANFHQNSHWVGGKMPTSVQPCKSCIFSWPTKDGAE